MKNLQSWAKNFNYNLATAFITLIGLILTGTIIYTLTPDGLDLNFIHNNFALPNNSFVSEKAERLTYIINTLLFIPLFCLSFVAVKKYFKPKDDIKFLNNFSALTSILLILFLITAIPFALHFYFGINMQFIIKNSALIILFLFTAGACYYFKDKNFFEGKTFTAISLILLLLCMAKILFFFPTVIMDQSFMDAFHFEAFSYPIYKAEQGLILGNDFRNIYGYYPYFYALLSNIIGAMSTFKITLINAFLLLITWLCGIFYIYKITKNKLFAFLLSIVFIYLTGGNFSYYLQFAPLRIIAFAVLLLLVTLYTQKQKKSLIFLGFLFSALAIVWNFETGLINIIAWTAFLSYAELNNYTLKDKQFYFKTAKYLFYALITFIFALITFKYLPYFISGKTVMLKNILFAQNMFYTQGLMMGKINPLHPWFLPLIIYITALILALQPLLKCEKNEDKDLPLLVFLSIFGLGIYTYYQGRSFITNLITVLFPAILILPIIIKKIYQKISYFTAEKTENIKNMFYVLHFSIFYLIAFGALLFMFSVFILNLPKVRHAQQNWPIRQKVQYLAYLVQDKNPLIFTLDSAFYYKALNKKNNLPVAAPIDFFLKQDYYNLFSYLNRTKTSIVLDKEQFTRMNMFVPAELNELLQKTTHTQNDEFVLFEYKN